MDALVRILTVVFTWRENTMKQEYDFSKSKRGAVVPVPQGKTRVTLRLDDDLLGLVLE